MVPREEISKIRTNSRSYLDEQVMEEKKLPKDYKDNKTNYSRVFTEAKRQQRRKQLHHAHHGFPSGPALAHKIR